MNNSEVIKQKNQLIQTFGRRKCRKLSDHRHFLLSEILPEFKIEIDALPEKLNVKEILPNHERHVLEIGFGDGGHLFEKAKENAQIGFVGCEVFINGVTNLLKAIEKEGKEKFKNLKILNDDVFKLLEKILDDSFDLVYILFPDPWPKKKHHKRRIIQNDFLDLLAKKIRKNGKLVVATDHEDYACWMIEIFSNSKSFDWVCDEPSGWFVEPENWVKTKYQKKAEKNGTKIYYLEFNVKHV